MARQPRAAFAAPVAVGHDALDVPALAPALAFRQVEALPDQRSLELGDERKVASHVVGHGPVAILLGGRDDADSVSLELPLEHCQRRVVAAQPIEAGDDQDVVFAPLGPFHEREQLREVILGVLTYRATGALSNADETTALLLLAQAKGHRIHGEDGPPTDHLDVADEAPTD